MKLAKVYFKSKADYEAARENIKKGRRYVLHVDLDAVDPSILSQGVIVPIQEEIGLTEAEKRKLLLWLNENFEENDFLTSLSNGLKNFGRLTEKQLKALKKSYIQLEGKEP